MALFFEGVWALEVFILTSGLPHHLTNSTINTFIHSRVTDQQPLQDSGRLAGNDVTQVVIPFKDQDSANIVKTQLKDLSIKLQTTIQPVFVSQKIGQHLKEWETKPQLVNQQRVVYQFKCDTGSHVGFTRGHLYARLDGQEMHEQIRLSCQRDVLYQTINTEFERENVFNPC